MSEDTLKRLMEVKSIVYLCDNCSSNPTSGLQEMEKRLRDEIDGIDKKIDSYMQRKEDGLNSLKRAFTEAINEFKSEMSSYRKELQGKNMVHKHLNCTDVVVGLPGGLDDLVATAIKICSHYNINVTRAQWDSVMKEYYKTRTLKVCDVMGGDIDRQVYFNDHHSSATICHKINTFDNDEVIYNVKECAELLNSNVDH
ncbi:hypothetical protein FF38_07397 [Lucilia cuprina]|uniref:Uncharacterized protein n=1 Tax=Lucilia cuprina TaxID=7375 RepID=A0A0L0CH07_LUCCU|nr:hypothetical protein FF38_07397 [Lucilia cuprina]